MCLIALKWDPDSQSPLIMTANRDEFYQRPTRSAHYWEEHPDVFGGLDLRAGGTWMAVSKQGRLAAITNFRELDPSGEVSRGELTRNFLIQSSSIESSSIESSSIESSEPVSAGDYLNQVHDRHDVYAGFNLLLGDHTGLWYYSNREKVVRKLEPGLYGLSNGLLNTPWPKVRRLKKRLHKAIDDQQANPRHLIDLLHDNYHPPVEELPQTGVDPVWEQTLSPCFIRSPNYGTRNSTALTLNREGILHWHEQLYDQGGEWGQPIIENIPMGENLLT